MSNVKARRVVADHTIGGRRFTVERIEWKNSDGLSFDVYDAATGQCLTAESFDGEPDRDEVLALLRRIEEGLNGQGWLDPFFEGKREQLRRIVAAWRRVGPPRGPV